MSRYRWGNGKWHNCLPNSKIKYDSGSDTEEEENKKVQAPTEQSKQSNISSNPQEEIPSKEHSPQTKSRAHEEKPKSRPTIRKNLKVIAKVIILRLHVPCSKALQFFNFRMPSKKRADAAAYIEDNLSLRVKIKTDRDNPDLSYFFRVLVRDE